MAAKRTPRRSEYLEKVSYLNGLADALPEDSGGDRKLLLGIIDALNACADAITLNARGVSECRAETGELQDDLQTLSDEIGELESLGDDMDRLDEALDALGETLNMFAAMNGAPQPLPRHPSAKNNITPFPGTEPELFSGGAEDDAAELAFRTLDNMISFECPHCGERIHLSDLAGESRDTD